MCSKQLTIPGLEPSNRTKPSKRLERATDKERLANLESRMLALELEVTLFRTQLEQEEDHA